MNDALMTYLVWPAIKFSIAFVIVMLVIVAMTWIERRLLGLMQVRLGPNRVGPFGLFQVIADPVKLLLKEDILPARAEKVAYFLGPIIPLFPAFIVFCLIPFGPPPTFMVTRVNVGILLILAFSSTAVYGLILGGWASNNKFSLMGSLRSAAQAVSYEVPFGLSIIGLLMMAGSLDLVQIVRYQEANAWNFVPQIVACFIFFVAMNAENNRTPFDLPEAESELVAGYHTEYSGMKFALFMMGEYAMMIVNSSLIVTLFFGGWSFGMFGFGLTTEVLTGMGLLGGLLGVGIFFTKMMMFMLVYVWFRATFPRFRFDQLMDLGWKFLIPLALANIFVTGLFILAGQERSMNLIGLAVIGAVVFHLARKPGKKKSKPAPGKVIHAS
ncbi:MAG TPA: NADH-quinone oxidoreductase subunit NuoH [Thermoanaerobaculia bacterium]